MNGRFYLPFPYPGVKQRMASLADYRLYQHWTASWNFRVQVKWLKIPVEDVNRLIERHDRYVRVVGENSGFDPLTRFRRLALRLYDAHEELRAMSI